jgi:hypothetical protein
MRTAWILGLGASLSLVGCNKPPAEYHYRLMLPGNDAPDRADLLMGEKKIGTFFRGDATADSRNERSRGFADVLFPAETTLALHQGELSVVIQSAAGSKRVPVKLAEGTPIYPGRPGNTVWSAAYEAEQRARVDKARSDNQMRMLIDVPISIDMGSLPAGVAPGPMITLYIDRHLKDGTPTDKQQAITIGALKVPAGFPHWATDGLGVAYGTKLPIAVDGKVVGTLELDPKAKGYIISTEPACYRLDTIVYASINSKNPGPGGSTSHFTGKKVAYSLWSPEIGYFLQEAPHSERGATSTSQVLREPCAP